MKNKKIKILVLSGGPSSERDVSIKSGKSIIKNLNKNKYIVSSLIVSKDLNKFFTDKNKNLILKSDIVFIALHGYFGEDGKIQSYLESLNIPYTGSSSLSSFICMNKSISSSILSNFKIKQPKSIISNNKDLKKIDLKKLNFPVFIKPNSGGSSDGAFIIKNLKEFNDKSNLFFKFDKEVLIQEFIEGKELTCAVFGDGQDIFALPPVEIPKQGDFFDRKIKYSKGTIEICPANISIKQTKILQNLAIMAHKNLLCSGITRSDFILKGNNFYYLETNTIPGMTETSLVPKEAKAQGLDFSILLDMIIENGLNRWK